ncbi:MAG: class I SAM-dependent methyltransferase [Acidimicrobiales bacterium]
MTNKHLDYDEPVLGYHRIVADLADRRLPFQGRVLDLGCGPGQIIGRLARQRPDIDIFGVDGDGECLRRAKARCPAATLIQGDIEAPPDDRALDGPFDVIVSSHSLEHLSDPVGALTRWRELLTDGGKLVIAVPNSLQPLLLARALTRRAKSNDGHFYIWDRATFENFCRLAGFEVLATAQDYVPLAPVRLRQRMPAIAIVERALLKPLPQFSNSHIVVLEPA